MLLFFCCWFLLLSLVLESLVLAGLLACLVDREESFSFWLHNKGKKEEQNRQPMWSCSNGSSFPFFRFLCLSVIREPLTTLVAVLHHVVSNISPHSEMHGFAFPSAQSLFRWVHGPSPKVMCCLVGLSVVLAIGKRVLLRCVASVRSLGTS